MLHKEALCVAALRAEIVALYKDVHDVSARTRAQAWVLRRRMEDSYAFFTNRLPFTEWVARTKALPKVCWCDSVIV
jgi:hypothetical protein